MPQGRGPKASFPVFGALCAQRVGFADTRKDRDPQNGAPVLFCASQWKSSAMEKACVCPAGRATIPFFSVRTPVVWMSSSRPSQGSMQT